MKSTANRIALALALANLGLPVALRLAGLKGLGLILVSIPCLVGGAIVSVIVVVSLTPDRTVHVPAPLTPEEALFEALERDFQDGAR